MTTQGDSERQLRDVTAILETQADALDHDYLHRWIRALAVKHAWERARQLVE